MAIRYPDEEIVQMLRERKRLPDDYRLRMQLKEKRGHKERELDIAGEEGNEYRVIFRQSNSNILDFSIILALEPKESNRRFRLRRYNGKSHEHTNRIEHNTFYEFHIHTATERYQEIGADEDAYAEPTDRYADFDSAFRCLIRDCGFTLPENAQLSLLEGLEP
ncbi:MAG: hypothetical protein HY706_13705 [Candidatus Hydrogenedentes bacterium]|nr:hypothetical protein [Candidatus Hydrogenedentota bacterium]